ncbi:MAG TPA: SpoIIIAH-like family protein [Candidatus Faecimorpha stercoravium]|nr:SpoIIIAH-like family protein [Candidatus Faecimorpha stercoravium]
MSRFRKNQAVIVALVLMVVVAGYLNFSSQTASATDPNQQAAEDSSEGQFLADGFEEGTLLPVGETSTVSEEANAGTEESQIAEESDGEQATEAEAEAQTGEESAVPEETGDDLPGSAVLVDSDAVIPEYFAEAKVERENARAKSQDILYDLMASADTPESEKSLAAQEIIALQKRVENEAAAEAMIKAKGFNEVFVRIYDESVDVIVDREEISQQEAAQIQDIITRITGAEASDIRISLLKVASEGSSQEESSGN